MGFSGQLIEVRGLFATSSVALLDLLDVILHIPRYDLIEVRGDEDTFPSYFCMLCCADDFAGENCNCDVMLS